MIIKKEATVKNRTGLHARPAAVFVQVANKYDSEITIIKDDQEVNGKSIMGILMLAAEKGSRITIVADGNDAQEAADELAGLIASDIEQDITGKSRDK